MRGRFCRPLLSCNWESTLSQLRELLEPNGIAIIGASADLSRTGGQVVGALKGNGYQGGIYPVNPKYQEIAGLACYATTAEVPDPCDMAVIALPAAMLPDTIRQCGDRGIKCAVVLSGGFRESGEAGQQLEQALLDAARAANVRLIGPNCLGFVNVATKAYAAFGSLTRPPLLASGPVSAVIQSGGFGNSLVRLCSEAGIGFRHVVASGNETDISTPELIEAFADDTETKVILCYAEGIADGRKLMAAARRAKAAGKPVILWKAGNSEQGAKAAASHTANMTGSYDVYRAACRQAGIIEVQDIQQTIDYVKTILAARPARSKNVAIIGGSGGSAVVFADAADEYGIRMARLSPATAEILSEALPSIASLDNPIDYAAGFLVPQNRERFKTALAAILADENVDQVGFILATTSIAGATMAAEAARELASQHDKPLMVFWTEARHAVPEVYEIFERAQMPVLSSPGAMARAMAMLADFSAIEVCVGPETAAPMDAGVPAASGALDELASKALIARHGVPVTRDIRLSLHVEASAPELAALDFPVALKIVSADIAHKSDLGGVALNIQSPAELVETMQRMLASVTDKKPDAKIEGFIASTMVTDGLETIVGVVNDNIFGPVVAFGLGGIFTEVLRDITYRIAPFDLTTAREMIQELRSSPMLTGVRGQAGRDVEALARTLVGISDMAWAMRDSLTEIDINPLMVLPDGKGVVAVDALAVFK